MESRHFRTCPFCEAMCGLEITVRDGEPVSVRGDREHVHSRGYLCPKAMALLDLHQDPQRLTKPVRRRGGDWEEIGWDEALDEAAGRLRSVQRRHGKDALATYAGNPAVHNTGTLLHLYDLYRVLGTRNRYASHSLDQLPLMVVCGALFGHLALFPVPDLERTDHFLVFGANPLVSNGSLMSTPNVAGRLRALRERGGRLVVADPRRTRTAALADAHWPVRPGSDAAVLLALLHVVLEEGLADPGRVAAFTDGLDALPGLLRDWTPERAERVSGLPAETLRAEARAFATAPRAVAYGRLGVSTQEHGTLCQWALVALNLITGNLDAPGGLMFSRPAVDLLRLLAPESHHGQWHSRVRGLPETGGDLPTAALVEEMETPGAGQVRGLLTVAGNPVLSAPDGPRLDRALAGLEAYVAIDLYVNETTRHAHLILPPTTGLEVFHYDLALQLVNPRNQADYSPPVCPPGPDRRADHAILRGLHARLAPPWHPLRWLAALGPLTRLDLALKLGPYGVWGGRFGRKDGLSLARLRRHPHGLDLGPLEPALPGRLFHRPRRIRLLPDWLPEALRSADRAFSAPAMDAGASRTKAEGDRSFQLIGRRHLRSNNSWMHHLPSLQGGSNRCALFLHPEDAADAGWREGDRMEVQADGTMVRLPLALDPGLTRGVASIPHGWGHDPGEPDARFWVRDDRQRGVNANALTRTERTDSVSGNAVFQGMTVRVRASANA